MRGASRASLAEAKERLTAVLADGADPGQLGDELFAVTGLLDDEAGLRRVLSDPTRDARAKAGLARTLLEGKIAPATLGLVPARRDRAARRARDRRGREPGRPAGRRRG